MELVSTSGPGSLYRCSEEFVALMRSANDEAIRLGSLDKANGDNDLTLFMAHHHSLDAAWLEAGSWHRAQVSTSNRLIRMAWARTAQDKSQPLFCWYGPPVPQYVIMSGTGPYPEGAFK